MRRQIVPVAGAEIIDHRDAIARLQKPLYQVLGLDLTAEAKEQDRAGKVQSAADILRRVLQTKPETGGTHD